ncbi:alanine racemase [Frigoribacterium sp. UYMn621]|uniref:alanine racemase n=1 Tax=Frigoribacterium sp. UYMn621 TaxID=3156343 RepID=UPI0033942775
MASSDPMTVPTATVDLSAYRRNLARLSERIAPAALMAVVKADAYGHGLVPVARAAVEAGLGWIGSLDIETGLILRENGIPREVAVFTWLLGPGEDYAAAIEAELDLGVSTIGQLEAIAGAGAPLRARVHLKIDTGLHRNGASIHEWPGLVARAIELSDRVELVGAWTHIAEASDDDDSIAIERFTTAVAVAEGLGARFAVRHLAASAAAFARADARFDLVRIGAFSYGISPGGGITPSSLWLEPVMTLTAPVIAVRDGLATVGIGFGDGIPSAAAGVLQLSIYGRLHEIVAVHIDTLVVETGEALVRSGDTAVLFGSGADGEPTLQEWADELGTIGEEIVTRLSPRIRRRFFE